MTGPMELVDSIEIEHRGHRLQVETLIGPSVPGNDLVTAAFALSFDHEDRILMVQLADRDWHPTGGHREPEEGPADAAVREVAEEGGCVVGRLSPVGLQRITMLGDERPEAWPYPLPTGYQVFFAARIEPGQSPRAGTEAVAARLFSPDEARDLDWVRRWPWLYEAALDRIRRS